MVSSLETIAKKQTIRTNFSYMWKQSSSTLKNPVYKEEHNIHKYEVKAVTYLSTRETSKVFKI